jgi:type VI secretion system protein ImpH
VPDDVLLYYAGHFSHRPRSAVALQQIVADCFSVATEVKQFQGQWLKLRRPDCTQLTSGPFVRGNNQLGVSAIVGDRVWGIENKIRLRLGPISYSDFRKFLPGAVGYVALGQFVRFFVGPTLDFDIQLILTKDEVLPCQVKRSGEMRLGWNTWLLNASPKHDVDDAVFAYEGVGETFRSEDVWGLLRNVREDGSRRSVRTV